MSHHRSGLLVLCLSLLLAAPASAQLQSEGVIYAYMMMRVGTSHQPVLIPIAAEQVRPDMPLQATIPAAFGMLRYGKPATYGNSSVTVSDALIAQERVAVNLDPGTDPSAFQVIAAETTLTFAALGIERVIFPGYADDGLTADDIEYARFVFEVPMWQALVGGGEVPGAMVALPDGDRLPSAEFAERMADGDPRLHQAALDALADDNRVSTYYLLTVVAGLGIDGYEEAVIPLLSDADPAYRGTALNALATSTDEDAWEAVVTMMGSDPVPELRDAAAVALSRSPVTSFHVYEVFHRAASPDANVRMAALEQMGAMDDPRVEQQLTAFLASPDVETRRSAADALHGLQAWDALVDAMNDDALDDEVRFLAATALATDAEGTARRDGLAFRGARSVGEPAINAVNALATMSGADTRTTIEGFLTHSDVAVGIHAAGVLASGGDEDSLSALSDVATDEGRPLDLRVACDDAAFDIVSGLSTGDIESYAAGRDAFLRRAGYRALGVLAAEGRAGSDVFDTLVRGLSDGDAGIRGASARALSSYASGEALEQIMTLEADPSPEVQADVALALGAFEGEAFADTTSPTLVGYVESGEPVIIAAALDALAMLGRSSLLAVVLDKVRYPDARVRASAMRAAAELASPQDLQPVINAVGAGLRDDSVPNRVLSATLLGRFNHALAILSLSQVVNGNEPEVRYAAIAALGQTSHPDAVGTLLALLEDPQREIRLAAVDALRTLNFTQAMPGIEAQMARETDPASVSALEGLYDHLRANGI